MFKWLFPPETDHMVWTPDPAMAAAVERNLRALRITFAKHVTDDLVYGYAIRTTDRKWNNLVINTTIDIAERGASNA